MLLQISLVVLLALINGFFALSEMALMVAAQEPPQASRADQPARQGRTGSGAEAGKFSSPRFRCSSRCCR